jgi:predicted molibdopterin-dependent oxidoreductase YjgC
MIENIMDGKIKALWIIGENPVTGFPGGDMAAEALSSLEFLVVQDMFLTETAGLAKAVLPAASFAEKEGTFTNFEGRLRRLNKAVEPPGECLPDGGIIMKLAEKMGRPMPYSSIGEVAAEIEELVYKEDPARNGPGLYPMEHTPRTEKPGKNFPFTLLAGTFLYHSGGGTRSSYAARLRKFHPEAFVEIGAADAEKIGIGNGDRIKVVSPCGELTVLPRITDSLPEGMLFMPVSFPEAPAYRLFEVDFSPENKYPSLKAQRVRVERIQPDG